ncbi:ABC transporter ATP-binding protein [Dethiosulfatarculus sandiegensis]|uniref:ABC transporter n=1 Tax=Dethiosulfatarculus sandiegensis TaxID=1429043 RepID=A0A0D2JD15_9BACT|nr:ABC transporter ATP-binding protein [Dethiosulfatarculus sandiegensis]KIX13646.1 ABC transporter [Dethiosulfatarculus sandiegensis]
MIQVKGLSKRFGDTVLVDGLSFEAEKGEILGFLGPNGAGKTTTMRMLTGFFPPSAGEIRLAGHDVLEEPRKARSKLGYLPENTPLYPEMRVSEYLTFAGRVKGLCTKKAKAQAGRVMEQTGLAPRKGQLINQLSKGFRQRVGLAQALMGDPQVLILDEPSVGLDPSQIVEIRELIKGFAGEKTVVLSSHILAEVAATCTKVVIINQGRLAAQGAPDMLVKTGGSRQNLKITCLGDPQTLEDLLKKIKGVSRVRGNPAPDQEATTISLNLHLEGGEKARAELARTIVESGLELVEMTPFTASLEEVFIQFVTGRGEPEGEAL